LAAGRDGHVAADQKGQAAEHLLLGQAGFTGKQLADALREFLVVGHRAAIVTLPPVSTVIAMRRRPG
jgi:hypothetical protein